MNANKCPHCSTPLNSVEVEDVSVNVNAVPGWKGFTFACPHCRVVVGVQINPLAIKEDIINGVLRGLKQR